MGCCEYYYRLKVGNTLINQAFASSWGPLSWATMAEVPSSALREKSMGFGPWEGFGVGMTVNFVQPYFNALIGGRSAFVYAGIAPCAFAFIYFLLPELKGRSLEEVDAMFASGISPRQLENHQFAVYRTEELDADKLEAEDKAFEADHLENGRVLS